MDQCFLYCQVQNDCDARYYAERSSPRQRRP
jgi:hypothetical protein